MIDWVLRRMAEMTAPYEYMRSLLYWLQGWPPGHQASAPIIRRTLNDN
jgi:hypothetical protein